MKLLEAQPTPVPGAPAAPEPAPAPAPPQDRAPTPAPSRVCEACGAAMQPEQDWCLSCGTAAPGRLGRRPGWRAAATIATLTLLLVAGSVAAAYAALTSDATREAAAPPPPAAGPVAQAPPATPPSSAQPPAPKPKLPTVKAPSSASEPGGAVKPVTPPASKSPTPSAPPVAPGSGGTGNGTGTGNADEGTSKNHDQGGEQTPAPEPTGPVAIELPGDAGALYDPAQQADTPGDPTLAIDGDPTSSFDVGALTPDWGLGYVIDLQTRRDLQRVRIKSPTPGFQVEVYATADKAPPAQVTDEGWTRLADRTVIGSTRKTSTIDLPDAQTKYRHLLLWITAGPADGARVSLSEVTVLG